MFDGVEGLEELLGVEGRVDVDLLADLLAGVRDDLAADDEVVVGGLFLAALLAGVLAGFLADCLAGVLMGVFGLESANMAA